MPITVTVDPADLDTDEKLQLARLQIGEFSRRNAGAPEIASFPADLDAADADALAPALGVVYAFRQGQALSQRSAQLHPDSPQQMLRKLRQLDSQGKGKVSALIGAELARVTQGGGQRGGGN